MTSMPEQDSFVSLWQSAPEPDTRHLMEDLRRLKLLHQRHNRSVLAILCGIALLLIFEEATGRLASHGMLSVIWTVGVVAGVSWHKRARCNRLDTLTFDTVRLLKVMISQAKSDLFVARCLYGGVPLGAAASYFVLKFASTASPESVGSAHPRLEMAQTSAGVAALMVMMVVGIILARSRSPQVRKLREKLKAVQD